MILATGARLKTLGVEGEERLQGRGVSHCASCDAPLMRDRTVGVVGGGDSALQEALTLAEAVGEVIVLHRGDALTAQAAYREPALAHPKISVRYGVDGRGDPRRGRRQRRARARRCASGDTQELELGGLFIYVGLAPNSDYLRDLLDARRRRARPDRRRRCRPSSPACSRPGSCAAARSRRRPSRPARARRRPRRRTATSARRAASATSGGRGRPRQRRLTWLRSSPSTIRAAIRRRSPASRSRPRLQSLEGQTLYLVDCLFDNSEAFVDQLHAWFSEHMPGVEIKRIAPEGELGRRPRDVRARSRPTGTPPSWRWVSEAPVARRSSGSRRRWRATTGSRRWPCTRTCSPASRARWRAPTGCRRPARSSSRSLSSGAPSDGAARLRRRRGPRQRRARSCSSWSRG